jgi:alpha-N-arabinofuranosidase
VYFDWTEYRGRDPVFELPLKAGEFRNPILAGYFPDPAIERVGDRYYLVNSTFTHFPGLPIHESTDLVNWRLVGHAISDPRQFDFDGLATSRGMFAPSIHFHRGTWYVICTLVDRGGNFFVTADRPEGPWSAPMWLKDIDGIDPSFFFDDDGKVYVLNNGPPDEVPRYDGHRAIWVQQFDLEERRLIGPRRVLVNGGVHISEKPAWIEGPHLFKRDGWYYLSCAEGGTSVNHRQVIFRSRSPMGPFVAYAGNPILTQKDLPEDRPEPITSAGHASLFEGPDGNWWAVFLATRPYEGNLYNTGRETFLLPVTWRDGWPVILEKGRVIPWTLAAPLPRHAPAEAPVTALPLSGNFISRDEFNKPALDPQWMQLRVPTRNWWDLAAMPGQLRIEPLATSLAQQVNPSFLGRRQQHMHFDFSSALTPPQEEGVSAGIAAFQSDEYWLFLGTRRVGGQLQLFLERRRGAEESLVASMAIETPDALRLRIRGDAGRYSFEFAADNSTEWTTLAADQDATLLSTQVAGGFVGTLLGPYARRDAPLPGVDPGRAAIAHRTVHSAPD